MQLVQLATYNITVLSYGSTCTIQPFRDILADEVKRRGRESQISLTCATFEMGFDPCLKLDRMKPIFDKYNVTMTRKCRFWTPEMYDASDVILVQDNETEDTARYLLDGDQKRKLARVSSTKDLAISSDDNEPFFAEARELARRIVDEAEKRLGELQAAINKSDL